MELLQVFLALGSHTDRLSITPPTHLPCSSLCPWLLSFTCLLVAVAQMLPTSCQSERLLLRSCRSGRTSCIHLYILLLLQHDPQHHLSSLLVAAITCLVDASGELTSTLLLPSSLLNVPSCCCLLFYKVFSTRVSTRSSMMPFVLPTAQHTLVLLVRSWDEETQSHLSEKGPSLCSEDQHKGAGTGNPSWSPVTLSAGMQKARRKGLLWHI